MSSNSADRLSKPVDIHLYVVRAGDVLKLTMVSAHLGFPALEGVSARFPRDPENLANRFFSAAESLDRGEGAGTRLISEEPVTELRDRSRDLYRQIFPRNFRSRLDDPELSGCSLVIETNEPWIPWEMLHTDGRDGDFLCLRFNLARWLRGQVEPPPSVLEISRILCVDAGNLRDSDTSELPGVAKEIEAIKRFSDRVPGILCSEVERPPVFASTQGAIARTCANVLHLSGHGGLDENAAFLVLADRRLYPWNLTPSQHPDLLTALCETRPLIFLNACRNGRRQEGFVGFAGWPDTLIKANACGGFIAPALPVRDRCATAFAVDFYRALEAGHFLGEAVRQARIQAVSSSNRASGTQKSRLIEILSYSFYGHPNAKIRLGSERRSVASESVGSINQATQASRVFLSSRSHSHAILERITESLEAAGSEVSAGSWRLPGVSWSEALTQRLVATDVLVVLVSPPGLSNWQLREIQAVTSERTIFSPRVVVVLLPGGKPPLNLLRFSDWVDLRTDPYDSRRLAMLVSLVVRSRKNIGETKCGTEERVKVCPYRGLLAFREEDAVAYFGRTRDIERLETALERHRIITIYGASGSGKSSLVRAGLSSRLRRATDSAWEIIAFQPGEDPIEALALACWPFLESEDSTRDEVYREGWIERFCQGLREDPSRFANYGRRILEKQIGTDRLLMIVDQAEDLFTKVDEETRRVFSEALISASRGPSLWALLTLRGKFLEEALEDPSLGTCVEQSSLALRSIDRSALIEIIERPAELGEVAIDPHLAKRIIADVDKEPGSLPILEFALTELWNASGGVGLRTIDYDGFGGVKHVIANRAETLYSELSGAEANALRILFLELVSPGETVDTRRQVRSDEIPEIAQAVVDRLVDARLLTTSSTGDESAEGTVEVAHEALITHWDRLQDWIEADREFLLWRERLRRASDRWIRDDRRKRALWEKGDLIEGERWMAERPDLGNDEFLVQSLAARSRKQWIDRSATLLIVFLALAAGVFGVRSLYEAEQVRVQARTIRSQALLTNAANHPDPSIGARVLANLGTQDPLGQSIHALDIGHKIVKQFGAERRIFFDGGEGIISDDA